MSAVQLATEEDLRHILGWLEEEYHEMATGEGFWCNRDIIEKSQTEQELFVVREDNKAVSFWVEELDDCSPAIVETKPTHRGKGYATLLYEAALVRARKAGNFIMELECMPHSSFLFWEKKGFEAYLCGADYDETRLLMRRAVTNDLYFPSLGYQQVIVKIEIWCPSGYRNIQRARTLKVAEGRIQGRFCHFKHPLIITNNISYDTLYTKIRIEMSKGEVFNCVCECEIRDKEIKEMGLYEEFNHFIIDRLRIGDNEVLLPTGDPKDEPIERVKKFLDSKHIFYQDQREEFPEFDEEEFKENLERSFDFYADANVNELEGAITNVLF